MRYNGRKSEIILFCIINFLIAACGQDCKKKPVVAFIQHAYIETFKEDSLVDNTYPPQIDLTTYIINYEQDPLLVTINGVKNKKPASKIIGVYEVEGDTLEFYSRNSGGLQLTIGSKDFTGFGLQLDLNEVKAKYNKKKHKFYRDYIVEFIQNADFYFIPNPKDTMGGFLSPSEIPIARKSNMSIYYLDPNSSAID